MNLYNKLILVKLHALTSSLLFVVLISYSTVAVHAQQHGKQQDVLPLEGIWKFKLDPFETGVNSNGVQ